MKEKLLKQMIEIVDATMQSYKSDFYEHDLRTLISMKDDAKFFWLCDRSHTALGVIDHDYLWQEIEKSEMVRFCLMQDDESALGSFLYWMKTMSSTARTYFFDGENLKRAFGGICYVYEVWKPVYEQLKSEVKERYPHEWEYYHKGQRIEFSSSAVRRDFLNVLRKAENPQSLLYVAEAMRYYARRAVNERVVICHDFADKCFGFYQERNGQLIFNGGIIYYPPVGSNPEHWQVHT